MAKGNFSWVPGWKHEFETKGWWHSFELPDGRRIEGVCALEGLRKRLEQFPIPEDLRGARVLDIGAWDGWYTFEMERRGAEVVAVDCWDNPRFHQMRAVLNSRADYRLMDVYDLTPATVGRFDIVLFMGVLYHLKHPLLALERVCAITTNLAAVDSFILQKKHRPGEKVDARPMMEFYESEEFGGQSDNWCAPNLACLMAMCRTAGFARVEHRATMPFGASVACYRTWAPAGEPSGAAPELIGAFHCTNFGMNFQTRCDNYVGVSFRAAGELALDDVRPEVSGYGVRPIHLSRAEDGSWRANFKLPPGLAPGWHEVTLRAGNSPSSNARRIAVDLPTDAGPVRIEGTRDGSTWEPNRLALGRGNVLSVWVSGLAESADHASIRVSLGGERLQIIFVEPAGANPARQLNVHVPADAPAGELELEVNRSAPVAIRIEA